MSTEGERQQQRESSHVADVDEPNEPATSFDLVQLPGMGLVSLCDPVSLRGCGAPPAASFQFHCV